ncbi:hypothetical protein A4G20_01150 [Pasteurellaceae bacterium RH1A]|nr:hypothetical protein A4G20_01150 [Pasteurellaceae bacterium RH1A]
MKINQAYLQRCHECDNLVAIPDHIPHHAACCPNCDEVLQKGNYWNLTQSASIALAILILLPFALTFPLMSIDLLGVPIKATVWDGVWKMATSGFDVTAFMVLLCAVIMPFVFPVLVLLVAIQRILRHRPRYTLIFLKHAKQWVMLDVYFVALMVAAFKVRDYAPLSFDKYLVAFVITTLLMTLLFIKLDLNRLWTQFYPEYHRVSPTEKNQNLALCPQCEYSFSENIIDEEGCRRCPRCETNLSTPESIKLQRVWATLIAGTIMMFPANLLPISSTELAGAVSQDSLMSGVMTFIGMGSYAVAAIVFIASIAVPFSKVAIIFYLLLAIHYRWAHNIHWQMKLLHYVHFVGRWSMLDLFVLALMMSLVERGQIISFSVGEAAFYFGAAVFLTMISSSNLDAKMLWQIHREKSQADQRP